MFPDCPTTVDSTVEHPFASVTVTVYVAGQRAEIPGVVKPFDHWYVYGADPPFTTLVTLPVQLLPHWLLVGVSTTDKPFPA